MRDRKKMILILRDSTDKYRTSRSTATVRSRGVRSNATSFLEGRAPSGGGGMKRSVVGCLPRSERRVAPTNGDAWKRRASRRPMVPRLATRSRYDLASNRDTGYMQSYRAPIKQDRWIRLRKSFHRFNYTDQRVK